MRQGLFTVLSNRPLARAVHEMRLAGDASAMAAAGQFVNVKVGNAYLRRPLSPADWDEGWLTLVYKAVGPGTAWLAERAQGETLDLLTGLGRGFDPGAAGERPLLVGGGAGLPPLYRLARELLALEKKPRLVMGFACGEDVFYEKEFKALLPVTVYTEDGSAGARGRVTDDPLRAEDTFLYACGPLPMLRALSALPLPGQMSLEERMACGFGACMGCTIMTRSGPRRVCAEGPVFPKEELLW